MSRHPSAAGPSPHSVIVGAGPAGVRVASLIAAGGHRVTLLGREAGVPYNRVALSGLLAGDMEVAALETVPHDAVAYRHGVHVETIDRVAQCVRLTDGEPIAYDRLVLATGSHAVRLRLPGADLPGVVLYRTLADVKAMMNAAAVGGRAIVIGGGLLGLEAAAGLARRGMAVTVIHAMDRLMERQLDPGGAERLRQRLAQQGIDVVLSATTVGIIGGDQARGVALADSRVIEADLIVMAVGIRPAIELAAGAGLPVNRGVIVDDAMRTDDDAIFAVGDCAEHDGVCCGLVAPAFAQAAVAATNVLGGTARYAVAYDATALKVAGAAIWSAGEATATDAESVVLDDAEDGQYRHLLVRNNRLVGAVLLGETADAPWYLNLIRDGANIAALRHALPFGPQFAA